MHTIYIHHHTQRKAYLHYWPGLCVSVQVGVDIPDFHRFINFVVGYIAVPAQNVDKEVVVNIFMTK